MKNWYITFYGEAISLNDLRSLTIDSYFYKEGDKKYRVFGNFEKGISIAMSNLFETQQEAADFIKNLIEKEEK